MPNHYPERFNKKRVPVQDYDMALILEDEAKVKKKSEIKPPLTFLTSFPIIG